MSWILNPGNRSLKVIECGAIRYTDNGFLLVFHSNFVPKTHCFYDIWLRKMSWPWNRGQRSLKVIVTDTCRSATYDFLLMFHSNHRPISHRFRDRRRFQSKSPIFPTLVYFAPPAEKVCLGIWYQRIGSKKLEWCGYGPSKKYDDAFSHVDIIHQRDRRTDGQTDGHWTTANTALMHSVAR